PGIVGRRVTLDGVGHTVVGVAGEGFGFPSQDEPTQLWVPVAEDAEPARYGGTIPTSRGYPRYAAALARLAPGVSLAAARREMDAISAGLAKEAPEFDADVRVKVSPALSWLTGQVQAPLGLLLGAVGCLLLIACTNVASLQLARAS